jgi:hypothetical protein
MTRLNTKTGIDIKDNKIVFINETPLIGQILQLLKTFKIEAWRNNTTGWYDEKTKKWKKFKYTKRGTSDILGYTPDGKIFGCECKTLRDRASKEQIEFIDGINNAGGTGLFAKYPEDVTEVLLEKGYIKYNKGRFECSN